MAERIPSRDQVMRTDPGPVSPPPYSVAAEPGKPHPLIGLAADLAGILDQIDSLIGKRNSVVEELDRIDRSLEERHEARRNLTRALRQTIAETDHGEDVPAKEAWRG